MEFHELCQLLTTVDLNRFVKEINLYFKEQITLNYSKENLINDDALVVEIIYDFIGKYLGYDWRKDKCDSYLELQEEFLHNIGSAILWNILEKE